MLKNIVLHFLFCVIVSLAAAFILDKYGPNCEPLCGLYYVYSIGFLLPVIFVVGLPVPMGMSKYSKENVATLNKRRMFIGLGVVGMLAVILVYLIFSFLTA